jgi:hypothetical protein
MTEPLNALQLAKKVVWRILFAVLYDQGEIMKAKKMLDIAQKRFNALKEMGVESRQIDGRKTIRSCTSLELLEHAAYLLEQLLAVDELSDVGLKRIKSLHARTSVVLESARVPI